MHCCGDDATRVGIMLLAQLYQLLHKSISVSRARNAGSWMLCLEQQLNTPPFFGLYAIMANNEFLPRHPSWRRVVARKLVAHSEHIIRQHDVLYIQSRNYLSCKIWRCCIPRLSTIICRILYAQLPHPSKAPAAMPHSTDPPLQFLPLYHQMCQPVPHSSCSLLDTQSREL